MYKSVKEGKQTETCELRRSKKQRKEENKNEKQCENMFVEELHNAVWPITNVDKFTQLLDSGNSIYLEAKHGRRQETVLHRYYVQILRY